MAYTIRFLTDHGIDHFIRDGQLFAIERFFNAAPEVHAIHSMRQARIVAGY